MTLEQLREFNEFKNVVDNDHAKQLADELDRSREVYYNTSNGYGTQDINDVLDMIEWKDDVGYLDGHIEIEVHKDRRPYNMEIPVEIEIENWLENCQCFEIESVMIKDIEEW